jgi:hypothetical protein
MALTDVDESTEPFELAAGGEPLAGSERVATSTGVLHPAIVNRVAATAIDSMHFMGSSTKKAKMRAASSAAPTFYA